MKGRMGSRIVADVSPAQLEAMEKTLENETKAAAVLLPDYYTLILYPLYFYFFSGWLRHFSTSRLRRSLLKGTSTSTKR